MSIKDALNKIKKTMLIAGLSAASMGAPLKTMAKEGVPDKSVTTTTQNTMDKRQQELDAAIRAGLPVEKIAQYVDFPKFIPVTKDGQFDVKKANELSKKLKPFMETLNKKGDSITAEEAYEVYKQAMGEHAVSFDEFEKVNTFFADRIAKEKKDTKNGKRFALGTSLCLTGLVLMGAWAYSPYGRNSWRDILESDNVKLAVLWANTMPLAMLLATALPSNNALLAKEAYKRMYDTYLQSTIEQQKGQPGKEFKMVEWKDFMPNAAKDR